MIDVDDALPGSDLIRQGLRDLASGTESIESLLVLVGAPGCAASASTFRTTRRFSPRIVSTRSLLKCLPACAPQPADLRHQLIPRALSLLNAGGDFGLQFFAVVGRDFFGGQDQDRDAGRGWMVF